MLRSYVREVFPAGCAISEWHIYLLQRKTKVGSQKVPRDAQLIEVAVLSPNQPKPLHTPSVESAELGGRAGRQIPRPAHSFCRGRDGGHEKCPMRTCWRQRLVGGSVIGRIRKDRPAPRCGP